MTRDRVLSAAFRSCWFISRCAPFFVSATNIKHLRAFVKYVSVIVFSYGFCRYVDGECDLTLFFLRDTLTYTYRLIGATNDHR